METDRQRGDYLDPKAGRETLGAIGRRWLASRTVDPSSRLRYESVFRLHVEPRFGRRAVKAIRPSDIQTWLADLTKKLGSSTAATAYLVLRGSLELAVADDALKKNPADSPIVSKPRAGAGGAVQPWSDEQVLALIDAHPAAFRLMPVIQAGCGLRWAEAAALAIEDFDFHEQVLHVRRQLKKLGTEHIYALPKNDRERDAPLPDWVAMSVRAHITAHRPSPCTLPWERLDGKPRTHNILICWTDGHHMTYRSYSELAWKPALARAGLIAEPTMDGRGRRRYATTRKEGSHQLRHYYASIALADGVSIKELAEYLGHHDPAFTLRVYAHLLPSSHKRARLAIDRRLLRPRAVSDGT
jgi:integrase